MRCENCGYTHPTVTNFCINCGNPFIVKCNKCKSENPPNASFCGTCGHLVSKQKSNTKTTSTDEAKYTELHLDDKGIDGERRQLTVMFCDLVDSTAYSEKFDPEDLQDILRIYHDLCSEVVEDLDGYIAQYLGDGLLVYFGYPSAHENDAENAVRAALEIIKKLEQVNNNLEKSKGINLRVRIGIHTGIVVVGNIGSGEKQEKIALGDVPNIAFQIQELCATNTINVSSVTHNLVEDSYDFNPADKKKLKGAAQKLGLYEVLRERKSIGEPDTKLTTGLTPLVGRKNEINLILDRWERTKEEYGQVVMLTGEPGIGKSRIAKAFRMQLEDKSYQSLKSYCSYYYRNSSLHPEIVNLEKLINFEDNDSNDEKILKLETMLRKFDLSLEDNVPIIAKLLSIPLPDRYQKSSLSPHILKKKTLEALVTFLLAQSVEKPIIKIIEDLQWADPSTIEFLSLLITHIPKSRILLILTFRPEFKVPWHIHSHITQILLNRLTTKQIDEMMDLIAGEKNMPVEIKREIIDKSDGVPLFVEELTKMIIESKDFTEGTESSELHKNFSRIEIPSKLHNPLMARIDMFSEYKNIMQIGAAIGREFSYELIKSVVPVGENFLNEGLSKFVDAELLYQKGVLPDASFIFKHALVERAAYESILKKKRKQYHRKIGETLEEKFARTSESKPELLAYHFSEADLSEKAVSYLLKAAEKAVMQSAHEEAINHLSKARELVTDSENFPRKEEKELQILTALIGPLRVVKGFASSEVEMVYTRARELTEKTGNTPELFMILRGLCGFYLAKAELNTSYAMAKRCYSLARDSDDFSSLIQANYLLAATSFCKGEIHLSSEYANKGISLYDPNKHSSQAKHYGQDPGVACLYWAACASWFLGYPDDAINKARQALKLAEELSHPYSISVALVLMAKIHQLRNEANYIRKYADRAISISHQHGFEFFLEMGTILRGWSLVEEGKLEEGTLEIEGGLDSWHVTGARLLYPYSIALLSHARSRMGEREEAIQLLDKAIEISRKNSELFYEAELYRLKGENIYKDEDSSESFYRNAIKISRNQRAKSIELRATTNLADLLSKKGDTGKARDMLRDCLSFFDNEIRTEDIKKAENVLKEIS